MSKEKISSLSLCLLTFSITSSTFLGIGFNRVFLNQGPSALLNILIGLIIGYFIVFVIFKIMDTEPELSLSQKIIKCFKKPFNYIINFTLIIVASLGAMLALWRIVDFLNSQYLSKTPSLLIGILVISLVFYIVCKNIEVLTRFSTIISVLCITMILINILSLIPEVDINNLKPFVVENNIFKMIKSSFYFAILLAGPCLFITMVPKENIVDKKRFNKMFLIYFTISGIILFLIFFFILACLGLDIISLYKYPAYIVLKKISILNFIESIENITFIIWYLYLNILCSLLLLFVKNSVIDIFKIKITKNKAITISLILSTITLLVPYFIFNGNYKIMNTITNMLPIILLELMFLLSLFYLIIYKIKKII